MYGWRSRVGYVGPPMLDVPPHEFWTYAPAGVVMVAAGAGEQRPGGSGWTFDQATLTRSVTELCKFEPETIVVNWGDVGLSSDADLRGLAADASAVPIVSDLDVLLDVLERRDVDQVCVASPWDDGHATAVAEILRAADHSVAGTAAAGSPHLCAAGALTVHEVIAVGRRAVGGSQPHTIVLASAHWRTLAAQDEIARALDVPVMSINGALLRNAQDLRRPAGSWGARQPEPVPSGGEEG